MNHIGRDIRPHGVHVRTTPHTPLYEFAPMTTMQAIHRISVAVAYLSVFGGDDPREAGASLLDIARMSDFLGEPLLHTAARNLHVTLFGQPAVDIDAVRSGGRALLGIMDEMFRENDTLYISSDGSNGKA